MPRVRVVSCGFNACCAGVNGSGMRASTRWAAGDGVVVSTTVPLGVTTDADSGGVTAAGDDVVGVPAEVGGAPADVGLGADVIGAQLVAAAATIAATPSPH